MKIRKLRTFLPSIDFETSKQFYLDMGFELQWQGEDLIIFGVENHTFFLQNAYTKVWAENMMIQMHVDDLDELYAVCESLIQKYPGTKIRSIFTADYGRTFHLLDPAGVLWHMTEAAKQSE